MTQKEEPKPSSYLSSMAEQLKEFDRELMRLKLEAKQTTTKTAPKKLEQSIQKVQKKRDEFFEKIKKAKDSSSSAWSEVQFGLEAASRQLKSSFEKASDEVRKAA